MKTSLLVAAIAAALALAPTAAADLPHYGMFRIGVDIQPGEYRISTGQWGGQWTLCSNTTCSYDGGGIIDQGNIGGPGYLTIPASAKYLKLNDIRISPV